MVRLLLYGTAAALVFGDSFFPANTIRSIGTLGAFAALPMGFVARPLGGIVFGHIGDRFGRGRACLDPVHHGRRDLPDRPLPTSTIKSLCVLAAGLLLHFAFCRASLSGGEWGGGVLMISEYAPPEKRGYYAVAEPARRGRRFRVVLRGVSSDVQMLPQDAFMSWGWRVPFLLSILIFRCFGVYIRSKLPESRRLRECGDIGKETHIPVLEVIRKRHPKEILVAMGLRVAEMVSAYISRFSHSPTANSSASPIQTMLTGVIARHERRTVRDGAVGSSLRTGSAASPCIWTAPSLGSPLPSRSSGCSTARSPLIWLALLLGTAVCHGAMIGTQPSLMGELFSTEVRYSGMALGHEVASVFAGGLAPMLATALLAHYHAAWPVALMMMTMGLITVIALVYTRETVASRA